jgi:hypothetical protein
MSAPSFEKERATHELISHFKEAVKQYIVYDVSNRMTTVYVARTDAGDGDPCLRTDYTYAGASNRIIKMKESLDTWVSATMD